MVGARSAAHGARQPGQARRDAASCSAHVANHRSVTKGGVTFAHYVQYSYEGEKRAALDLWADRLTGIVSGGAEVVKLGWRGR